MSALFVDLNIFSIKKNPFAYGETPWKDISVRCAIVYCIVLIKLTSSRIAAFMIYKYRGKAFQTVIPHTCFALTEDTLVDSPQLFHKMYLSSWVGSICLCLNVSHTQYLGHCKLGLLKMYEYNL